MDLADSRPRRPSAVAIVAFVLLAPQAALGTQAPDRAPRFGRLGAEHELSSNWVLAVVRDNRGFLWVGTEDGLNRYDGSSVVVYRHSRDDPHSLPSSVAGVLFEDSRGRLWVGSRWASRGLARYDRDHDRFVRLPHGPDSGGPHDARVNALAEAPGGRLWVGTRRGLELVDPEGGPTRQFDYAGLAPGEKPPRQVVSLLSDRAGKLWVGTTEGLFVLRGDRCLRWRGPPAGLAAARIESLLEDDSGTLWAATVADGLFEIDAARRRVRQHVPRASDPRSLSSHHLRCLTLDGRGNLWIGTENGGLDVFDRNSRSFQTFAPNPFQPGAIGSASIYALHADRQGIVWIGTYNDGLNYLSPAEQRFRHVDASVDGLRDPHVSAFLEDRAGNLWIGTDGGGLARVDARSGEYSYVGDRTGERVLGSASVLTLLEDDRGAIWLGGWDGGVTRLDARSGRTRRFRHRDSDPSTIVSDYVWKLRLLRSGELLVATQAGTDLLDRATGRCRRLSEVFPGVRDTMTLTALEDSQGDLWLGQSGRVQHVARASGRVTTYANDGQGGLGSGMVFVLHEDRAGNLWIGGEGGLRCLPTQRPPGGKLVPVSGLPGRIVTNVLEDPTGGIWVTAGNGLALLAGAVNAPGPARLLHFDSADGLQEGGFTRGAGLRTRDGRMLLGGPRGYSVFRPEAIQLNQEPPPVVLTGVRVFDRTVLPGAPGSPLERSATETSAIVLPQELQVVSFEFVALNLLLPRKNRYQYRLEGLEREWNDAGGRGKATYTQLRHGDYLLRVRAANNDGVWSERGLALRIHVPPLWHERSTLRLLAVLLGMLGIVAGHRWRTRRLRQHERELALRVEERTRAVNQLNAELERRVAERTLELADEKERLAVTLRSIGDAVVTTDISSRIVLMNRNAERLSGWRAGEARGQLLTEVLPLRELESRNARPDPVASLLAAGGAVLQTGQSLLVRGDGTEIVVSESVAPIRDHESRTVGAVLVLRDITAQRRLEAQLQSRQKLEALGILAGGIAHDFNNLLTGVFGYLDLARHRAPNLRHREPLEQAMTVIERARGLTAQLLTFSRGGEPVTSPLALGELLRKSASFALSGSNVIADTRIPDDLWPCLGDRRQIDQVVDNLLLNARQAMPQGGTIRLRAENVRVHEAEHPPLAPGRYVRLTVEDQGPGIPAEIRSRIFEPFFTTKPQGSGLGLATVHSIVQKHGGCVDVESPPGRGTAFHVYLPATEATPGQASPAARPGAARSLRVLVMDDEDYLRDVVRHMLEALGHEVATVADGAAALAAVERSQAQGRAFDLWLLDLTIPGGPGGAAVLSRLREVDATTPAVASSGYSGDPVMCDPRAHGFAGGITKPYTMVELERAVALALENGENR